LPVIRQNVQAGAQINAYWPVFRKEKPGYPIFPGIVMIFMIF